MNITKVFESCMYFTKLKSLNTPTNITLEQLLKPAYSGLLRKDESATGTAKTILRPERFLCPSPAPHLFQPGAATACINDTGNVQY